MKQAKEQHWRGVIRDFIRSRLTQRDFCIAERIPYSTFQYWSKRLKGTIESPRFIAVTTEVKLRRKISVSFELGIRMIISDDIGVDLLSRVINAVSGAICESTGTK